MVGLHLLQQVADAAAFELEDALRLAALQQGERLLVVERELVADRLVLPVVCSISSTALSRIVRFRRPRKSIFSRPAASTSPIAHCVMMSVLPVTRQSGTYSVSGLSAMTTAAACVPTLRASPFELAGEVDSFADLRVAVVLLLQLGALLRALRRARCPSVSGTIAVSWLTRSSGTSSTRPTSLIAALAASVPNVPIWATFSSPYFSLT